MTSEKLEIKVTVTKKVFGAEDYGIYACEVSDADALSLELNTYGNITIKGKTQTIHIGEEYLVKLKKVEDKRHKGSYDILGIKQEKPITIEAQKSFFKMLLTAKQIENIYDVYEGYDIIQLIIDNKFDYDKVKGLGAKTYAKMKEKVMMNLEMGDLLVFVSEHGLKIEVMKKLLTHYEDPQLVLQKIEENPYILSEVRGIGFHKADEVAQAMGYDMKSPHRIQACFEHIILGENMSGHSWVDEKSLLNQAIDFLSLKKSFVEEVINSQETGLLNVDGMYTTEDIYETEKYLAEKLIHYKKNSKKFAPTEELDKFLDQYCEKHGVELETNQRQFFHDWNENPFVVLIGSGGTGKSWLQSILLEFIGSREISLLAPTGRASKVMSNYTGMEASTIHRKVRSFREDGDFIPAVIEEEILIVDESSMCDIFILQKLFRAIVNENVRILFVGDDFQLPSVGVGNFLYDVINSGVFKISMLTKVFRQKDDGILGVTTAMRQSKKFLDYKFSGRKVYGKDCIFWMTESKHIMKGVLMNYEKALKMVDQEEIAVITPTHNGELGTVALNREIQKIANPPSAQKKERAIGKGDKERIFRVGDLVMNLVNSYDVPSNAGSVDIFNGDTGTIRDIDFDDKFYIIEFDGYLVELGFGDALSQIVHGWAITIHKSQGSQYQIAILVVDGYMTYQLNANLLYVGCSRARKYLIVHGQSDVIIRAMKKKANLQRRSFLKELLIEMDNNPDRSIA